MRQSLPVKIRSRQDFHLSHTKCSNSALHFLATPRHHREEDPYDNERSRHLITLPTTNNNAQVTMSTAELATSYAALILADDGVEITVCIFFAPRKDSR